MEKFSQVTRFSRNTAGKNDHGETYIHTQIQVQANTDLSTSLAQFLDHPFTRPIVPLLPPSVQSLANNETVKATIDDYDSARVFLAKWAAGLADQSEKSEPFDQRYRHVGIWGHDDWEEETALGVFEVLNVSTLTFGLDGTWQGMTHTESGSTIFSKTDSNNSIPVHTRTSPVTLDHWKSFFNEEGVLEVGESFVRSAIFRGCLDPAARKDAWLFLTGVFPWDSSMEQRELIEKERK